MDIHSDVAVSSTYSQHIFIAMQNKKQKAISDIQDI